ncbi:DUF4142 domain-containing protein [Sorangium sp. So ce296]|uniref:DUF4142 domain-containing protein n=1 Tax=Sorangium sp. So ce296 TaxID=3133296 RepID=UPI003F5DE880
MKFRIDSLRFAWIAALALAGTSACSVAAGDGGLAAADQDSAEEAVESASLAFTLSIPELASVIDAFDTVQIAEAQTALTRATDAHVVELAQELLNHHTAANQQLRAALAQTGVTPDDNQVSRALIEQGASDQQTLEGLSGLSFDWTYVNLQIVRHQEFLAHLKEQLVVVGPELHPGISHLIPDIREATSRHLSFATSLTSLIGTPYVPENGNPPRAPYYGNGAPYYGNGAPYYGNGTPYYGNGAPYYGNGAPYYGNGAPYYGPVYYGANGPYMPAYPPYGGYGRSTSLGSGTPSPYPPSPGHRP